MLDEVVEVGGAVVRPDGSPALIGEAELPLVPREPVALADGVASVYPLDGAIPVLAPDAAVELVLLFNCDGTPGVEGREGRGDSPGPPPALREKYPLEALVLVSLSSGVGV